MQLSTFTIATDSYDGKSAVLFNGCTGAVDLVPISVWSRVQEAGARTLPAAVEAGFLRRGHLVAEPDVQQVRVGRVAKRLRRRDRRPSGFFLVTTYACQLRCTYCCQRPRWGHDGAHPQVMSLDLLERAFAVMRDVDRPMPPRPRSVTLYGGEPFQATTFALVRRAVEYCEREGYRLAAVTNGVDAEQFVALAGPRRLAGVCLSAHTLGDDRVWRDVLRNAEAFRAAGAMVAVRINVDRRTIGGLADALREAQERRWFSDTQVVWNVCPVIAPDFHAQRESLEPEEYEARIVDLLRRGEMPAAVEVDLAAGRQLAALLDTGVPSPMHPRHPAFCGSKRGLFVMDAYGDIYNCYDGVRDVSYRVGTFGASLDLDTDAIGSQAAWRSARREECESCPYLLVCGGGCVHRANGESSRGKQQCRWVAASMRLALRALSHDRATVRHTSWL